MFKILLITALLIVTPSCKDQHDKVMTSKRAVIRIITSDGFGSGVVVSDEGLVITSAALIGSNKEVLLVMGNTRAIVKVLYKDTNRGIAFVRVPRVYQIDPADIDFSPPRQGDDITLIGSPMGLNRLVTSGLVSGRRFFYLTDVIVSDAAVSNGSLGSGMFNAEGELIGVVIGLLNAVDDKLTLSISIPTGRFKETIKEIEKNS